MPSLDPKTPYDRIMRFTLRSMMLYIACVAGFLALSVRYLGTEYPVLLLAIPCLIVVVGHVLWVCRCRKIAVIAFVCISISGNCLYVVDTICPNYVFIRFLKVTWMLVLLPSIGAAGAAWAKLATRDDAIPRRSPLIAWALVIVSAILPAVTISTLWPLRLAFLAFRPGLERLADRVEAGQMIVSPRWIGPFRLAGSAVDSDSNTINLYIDPNRDGRRGLARARLRTPEVHRFRFLVGTDADVDLGWGWSYGQDDYFPELGIQVGGLAGEGVRHELPRWSFCPWLVRARLGRFG